MDTDELSLSSDRAYVAVRPTTDKLQPNQAANSLRALHGRAGETADPPTVEMLLVTAGIGDGITYLFGGDLDLQRLERALRSCFPTEYELRRTTTSLAEQLTPDATSGEELTPEALTPLTDRPVGGLEVRACEDHAGDWQTRLQPLDRFVEHDRADWPLADAVEALADSDIPVVLQTLFSP